MFEIREMLRHKLARIFVGPQMRLPSRMVIQAALPCIEPVRSRLSVPQSDMMKDSGDLVRIFGKGRFLILRVIREREVEIISLRRDHVLGRVPAPYEGKRDDGPCGLDAGSEIPESEDYEEYAICEEDGMCATESKG
jgi:hypothetical protein